MTNLVIVESPAKCAKIKSILGSGYNVIASMGHILALVPKLESVGIGSNFEPTYDWLATKAKAIAQIKEAAKGASKIIVASDADYEGNFIAYSLIKLLKLDPATTQRIIFTEITEKAIKNAVANHSVLDMNKVNAQQARSMLDLMIGFTISPLLWKSVGPALSAGRCQIPAVRLIADREETIKNFSSTLSWVISGDFKVKGNSLTFIGTLTDELDDEESAKNYLENHSDSAAAHVTAATIRPTTAQPPLPLITSTLQQQASNLYRAGPAQTMKSAQRLYEAGLITYMRTDHAVLSEDAQKEIGDYIIENWGEEYCSKLSGSRPESKAKGVATQDAHEAIRPTHVEQEVLGGEDWSSLDRNIYRLIWLRAVQSMMAAAKGEQCTVQYAFDDEDPKEWLWRASFSRTTFPGWKATVTKDTEEEDESADKQSDCSPITWQLVSKLKAGTVLSYVELRANAHLTKAISRYSEAQLIKDLEAKGIGRPSTYASLMETIQEKLYVEKRNTPSHTVTHNSYNVTPGHAVATAVEERKVGGEKDRLYPTALGLSVLEYCLEHFDDLFNYGFTAQMENRLDAIAAGSEPWKKVLKDTWESYKDRYEELNKESGGGKRREFANGIVAVSTAKGPVLLKEGEATTKKTKATATFYGWPAGKTLQSITQADVDAFLAQKSAEVTETILGTHNDTPIVRKKGPYGLYCEWGSVRIPWKEDATLESIIEDLDKKDGSMLRSVGDIVIKNGPYGIYMYKKGKAAAAGKAAYKPTFVTVPKDADWKTASEAELTAMYSAGVDQKKAAWKAKSKGKK